MSALIYFVERNIHGAWVVYGVDGIKQYYYCTKAEAIRKYKEDCRIITNKSRQEAAQMQFSYNGYHYWFSVIDCLYYKQKIGSFDKVEITEDEFNKADEARWDYLKR